MTTFVQETDYRTVDPGRSEFHRFVSEFVPNETLSGYPPSAYLTMPLGSDVLSSAWEFAYRLGQSDVGERSRTLLFIIQEIIWTMQQLELDPDYLPKLQSHWDEDGSVLFEWILPNFRIGFSIEADPSQSGWFLVTSEELGSITGSGYISGINLRRLIQWLMSFLVSYS